MRRQDVLVQREAILALAARHGAGNVRLFGSVVRDEATTESDVDFLVEMRSDHSTWFPVGLRLDLEELLGRPVEVVTEGMLTPEVRDTAVREAIAL